MLEKIGLVAELYYIYNLPQKKIAQQLGISRPWVSKLLKRAEESGIVNIEVNTSSSGVTSLETALKQKYKLTSAKVINSNISSEPILEICCRGAAHFLFSSLKPNDILAVSWGHTLATLANEFPEAEFNDLTIVPLVGGMGENASILSNHIVSTIAKKLNANSHLLHLPAFVSGQKEKDFFLKNPQVKSTVELAENADVLVCGIGTLENSTMVKDGYISPKELDELKALGAVGDIALNFIDKNGSIVDHPIHSRLISSNFGKIKKRARISLAVALGEEKVPVIEAALKGGFVDVLTTDSNTAELLLAKE